MPTKTTKPLAGDPTSVGANKPLTTKVKALTRRADPRAIPKKKDRAKPRKKTKVKKRWMAIALTSATPIAIHMLSSGATDVARAMPSTAVTRTPEVQPITAAEAKVTARRELRVEIGHQGDGVERIRARPSTFFAG